MQEEKQEDGDHSVLTELTPDQFDAIKEKAVRLVTQDQTLRRIFTVMVTARRIYSLGRLALNRELLKEGYNWSDGVEEFLIQAGLAESANPFSRADVITYVRDVMAEFLLDELNIEAEQLRWTSLVNKQQRDKARLESVIQFGPEAAYTIKRGDSLILVGTAEALAVEVSRRLAYLRDEGWPVAPIDEAVCPDFVPFHVTYWHADSFEVTETPATRNDVRYAAWCGILRCAVNARKMLENTMAVATFGQTDLLLVENLPVAYLRADEGTGLEELDPIELAGKAHKFLSRWCKQNNVAFVGTIPIPPDTEEHNVFVSNVRTRLGAYAQIHHVT